MKKYLLLLMVAALSIACGGNNAEKKEGEVKLTVEQQVKEKQEAITKAIAEGKTEEAAKLVKEYDEWYCKLSKEDKEAVDKALEAQVEAALDAADAAIDAVL